MACQPSAVGKLSTGWGSEARSHRRLSRCRSGSTGAGAAPWACARTIAAPPGSPTLARYQAARPTRTQTHSLLTEHDLGAAYTFPVVAGLVLLAEEQTADTSGGRLPQGSP